MLLVVVGSDSFGGGLLLDVEELGDCDDVPAAGAATSLIEAAGEQVALGAAALAGGPVTAAGAFLDAAGCARDGRGYWREGRCDGVVAGSVGDLSAVRGAPGAGLAGGHRAVAERAGWRHVRVTPGELRHREPPAVRPGRASAAWRARVRRVGGVRWVARAGRGAGRAGAGALRRSW